MDILGIGSATVDDLLFVPAFPQQDTKMEILRHERQGGGLCATALVAAARLGARVGFAGVLGHDEISRWVADDLAGEGIDVSQAVYREDAVPIHAHIIVDPSGSRTILYSVDGRIGADDELPSAEVIQSSRVLFIDDFGTSGNIRAARLARAAGIPIVADFELTDEPELLQQVDHLIVSACYAGRVTGTADPGLAARRLWHEQRAAVVVTCGDQGAWYADGEAPAHFQAAFRVEPVDTTGCGDVFHGAYAAALTWGLSLDERVRFASATAALKATQPGGRKGIPTRAAVEAFLMSGQ